jgi:uroporphyrinogen decarboxylase
MIYTNRERVLMALNHKEADKVPIDFGSTRSTGINALAYYKLKEYMKLTGPVRVYDVKQLLGDPDPEVLEFFQSDCIQLHRLSPSARVRLDAWKSEILMDGNRYEVPQNFSPTELEDGSHAIVDDHGRIVMKRPKGGLYFDDAYAPLADASENSDIDHFSYPTVSEEEIKFLQKNAEKLYNSTDYAVVFSTGISIFEKGIKDFGYEEFLVRIYTDTDMIERYLENLTEAYIKMLDKYVDAVGNNIQVIQFNDDLGMQNSTILQPDVYRKVFKPFHKRIYQYVKRKAPHLYTMLHCCGSIFDLIPDLIEAGVDAINPVQINAAKMDPVTLKREFGRDITFWGGGCSTQSTLSFGNLEDVREETKRLMDVFAPGGGFIFNQVHNIQSNIPPEKVIALYETAISNREYVQSGTQGK